MTDLRWFRLELDHGGNVISCVGVERAEANGRSWLYVQARDEKEAGHKAWNAYCRDRQRVRNATLAAEGKCICGRKNDRPGKSRCSVCHARRELHEERRRAKARGEEVAVLDKRVTLAARRVDEQRAVVASAAPSLRLAVLQEVLQAWQDEPTNGAFTAWLVREVEAAGGQRRAG